MEIDKPKVEQPESDGEGASSPPRKKAKSHTFDPIKHLLGKAQTFLNKDFIFYYKNVGIIDSEAEWEEFSEMLYKELPTTFRITSHTSSTEIVQAYMQEIFCSESTGAYELGGKLVVDKPTPLPWYPQELAYHFAASRKSLRTSSITKHLKHFLTHETEIGNISRQEAVSMVPPLLLDVESHHKILDMCASPGSKTCQLIELLHGKCAPSQTPSGFVMANDVHIARCYLLAHQVHRLCSPAILVTHYDATQFPFIKLNAVNANPADPTSVAKPEETLLFDRILCDVPCSGDGTIRKNSKAGSGWDLTSHFGLFKLQLAIAKRSAQLLKVGGKMVYSTCAFNPIEDEAVVAQLLRESKDLNVAFFDTIVCGAVAPRCRVPKGLEPWSSYDEVFIQAEGGALRLVDVSEKLPQLIRKPGINTWKVIDQKQKVYTSPDQVPERSRSRIPDAVFPPTAAEAADFHLERCMRFYPHLQDTGGFFVTLLEKVGETHFVDQEAVPTMAELGIDEDVKVPKPERGFSEDPFWTLPSHIGDGLKKGLREYYGVADVDSEHFAHLLIRSTQDPNALAEDGTELKPVGVDDVNMIYKVSAPVHDLLRRSSGHRFVSAGIRFVENFSKRNKHLTLDCDWRITAEGLSGVSHLLNRHVITVGLEDFRTLLRVHQPKFEEFSPKLTAHLAEVVKGGVGVVAIHIVPEPLSEDALAAMSKRERLINTSDQWVMGWLGFTSFTLAVRKLELMSWRNLYLTADYSFQFDPVINKISDEEKAVLIEANRKRKAERDAERKRDVKEAKAKRRADRRAERDPTESSDAKPEEETSAAEKLTEEQKE